MLDIGSSINASLLIPFLQEYYNRFRFSINFPAKSSPQNPLFSPLETIKAIQAIASELAKKIPQHDRGDKHLELR
jgi:hypothetical protein